MQLGKSSFCFLSCGVFKLKSLTMHVINLFIPIYCLFVFELFLPNVDDEKWEKKNPIKLLEFHVCPLKTVKLPISEIFFFLGLVTNSLLTICIKPKKNIYTLVPRIT